MNFLAHLFLSGNDENLIVGNFLGDFISNKQLVLLPPDIQLGVKLHQQIDSFTDSHPMVRKGVLRLRPTHRKYAPVILDVLYDYVLARNWTSYSDITLDVFTSRMYEILQRHKHIMPSYLEERLPAMIASDWLVHYGTEEGLRFTFDRMKLRSSNPHFFDNAVDSLLKDYELYETEFNAFFPDAIVHLKKFILENG